MVSALVSGSSGLDASPAWGHNSVVFLGKTPNTHSASIPQVAVKWVPANL